MSHPQAGMEPGSYCGSGIFRSLRLSLRWLFRAAIHSALQRIHRVLLAQVPVLP